MNTPQQILGSDVDHQPSESAEVERISLFSKSQADILKIVYSIDYRAPEHDTSFDVDALFSTTQNTILGLIEAISNIGGNGGPASTRSWVPFSLQSLNYPNQGLSVMMWRWVAALMGFLQLRQHKWIQLALPLDNSALPNENIVGKAIIGLDHAETTSASFSSQFCNVLLKSFGCKMSCEAPGNEVAFELRTRDILVNLSHYPCEAQAVFALAAFVSEFEVYSNRQLKLAKPIAAVVELNNLIKATFQVIECTLELEKLIFGDEDSKRKLTMAIGDFPFYAYWSIITLVACATQLSTLPSSDEDSKPYDLSQYSDKMNSNLDKIKGQLAVCRQEREEANAKKKFDELVRSSPREITKVFECLVLFQHKAYRQPPIISVDPTNQEVFNIHVLKGKRVLFYISTLDNVCDQDISSLKEIYDEIEKTKEAFKILWIPIVEDWSEDGREEKFKEWRSKMPWYAVQYFSPPAIGYLRKREYMKDNPTGLVMTQNGMLVNSIAFDGIPKEGAEALSYLKHDYLKIDGRAELGFGAQSAETFQTLVFPKGVEPQLFRGSSDTPLDVHNILWDKKILWFLSDVDVPDNYIGYLRREIYDRTWSRGSNVIVWVPIVKQWTYEKVEQFQNKRSTMPWYTVKLFSAIADLRHMEQRWKFKHKPTLVVMNAEGDVTNTNAFPW